MKQKQNFGTIGLITFFSMFILSALKVDNNIIYIGLFGISYIFEILSLIRKEPDKKLSIFSLVIFTIIILAYLLLVSSIDNTLPQSDSPIIQEVEGY